VTTTQHNGKAAVLKIRTQRFSQQPLVSFHITGHCEVAQIPGRPPPRLSRRFVALPHRKEIPEEQLLGRSPSPDRYPEGGPDADRPAERLEA
jgi:hypothetical protein